MNEKVKSWIEDGGMRITTVAIVIVFVLGVFGSAITFAYVESKWRTNISRDVLATNEKVDELTDLVRSRTLEDLRISDMRSWAKDLRRRNEGIIDVPLIEDHIGN